MAGICCDAAIADLPGIGLFRKKEHSTHQERDLEALQRYSLKERGRLIGEFSTSELCHMRDRNQLTRFHEVSRGGTRWEPAVGRYRDGSST